MEKAQELSLIIYHLFKNNRDFSFSDQIRRVYQHRQLLPKVLSVK